jgi:S1-C subfamily serine protease
MGLYLTLRNWDFAMSLRPKPFSILKFVVAAILLVSVPLGASAQERRLPTSPTELRLSYAPVVQRAAPAVVNVYAAKTVSVRNPLFDDPIFRRFFGVPGGPGGGEQMQRSLGSGVVVDAAGLVVTNNHVIEGADQVKVSLADKREFEAEIVLKDSRSDLAVLRLRRRTSASRRSNSPIPTRWRSATWCWRSAIHSRSGRP